MRLKPLAVLASAVLALLVVAGAPATSSAASGYPYTVHGTVQDSFTEEEGICGPPDNVTVDSKFVLHMNATEPGLTDEQVLAIFASEDPEGVVRSLTYTEEGSFVVNSGVHTYTGKFTIWFGFNDNQRMDEGTFTFKATGKSEQGTQLTVNFVSHGSETREMGFDRGHVKGCLPQP